MRFGIGWRPGIGAGILANLDQIDVIELLAEECTPGQERALRTLRSHVPIVVHATSLGLASPEPVDRRRLDAVARVVEWVKPDFWSEHLAFVRADGMEIGHLAAPPRNDATLQGLVRNVEQARQVIGRAPLLENVATLFDPPFSTYDEAGWLNAVLDATETELLLDLHNLHANATNFHFDARATIRSLPRDRIGAIHIAGGRGIEGDRILDDHLHDVPDPVFDLLSEVGAERATVILERDGNYPTMHALLGQLARARATPRVVALPTARRDGGGSGPSHAHRFFARLFTDDAARERFMARPYQEAIAAGFDEADARRIAVVDHVDLTLAARSFAKKRKRA
ncbi:MAG TPA: DUF692 domain-containing protein [Thermoanaerobaculia bacterium]|nr:DUF692 domain-containing protein [Thermoanaerobaculia bacterium]